MVGRMAAALAAGLALAGAAQAGVVEVRISGVRPRGALFVALCSQQEGWRACARRRKAAPEGPVTAVRFEAPPGRYAASVFQDVDGNGRLSFGMSGAPSEPWGYSRGAKAVMGPAAFKDAAVYVGPVGAVVPVPLAAR